MMKNLRDLRKAMQMLDQAMICPTCGKSRLRKTTTFKGHGTGVHGEAYYGAASVEPFDPQKHCTCGMEGDTNAQ